MIEVQVSGPKYKPSRFARGDQRKVAGRARKSHNGLSKSGGFRSRAQWKWAYATKKPWARQAAHRTAGGPKARYRRLPTRTAKPTARSAR